MIKPDYERDGVRLYLADCLNVLPELSGVDCTVTSPPYNQSIETFKASGFMAEGNKAWANRIASSYFDSLPEEDYQKWQRDVLDALYDCSVPSASVFYNHKCRWRDKSLLHPLDIFRSSKWRMRQEIIWSRDGSLTQNAKMFPPSEERILWGYKHKWKWNADSNRFMSVWRINSEHNSEHPVAYPIEIPTRCVEATTDPEDTVCDPFMGSGTTGVACIQTGRNFIGIERDPRWFAIAVKRIEAALNADRDSLWTAKQLADQQRELFTEQP